MMMKIMIMMMIIMMTVMMTMSKKRQLQWLCGQNVPLLSTLSRTKSKIMFLTRSLSGGPSGLLTSSFAPFGRSGRVTHAKLTNNSFSTALMHEFMNLWYRVIFSTGTPQFQCQKENRQAVFLRNMIYWNSSSDWLLGNFFFGTEIRGYQWKITL